MASSRNATLPPGRQSSDRRVFPNATLLIAVSGGWLALCLLMMRRAWLGDPDYDAGLVWELVAALPVVAWAVMLRRVGGWDLNRLQWRLLVGAAVLLRLVLLDLAPVQSDDLYRYIWEGKIQWAGYNPYRLAPNDVTLTPLRDDLWASINHSELPAIYPPGAQMVLAVAARAGEAVEARILTMKAVFALCEVLILILLGRGLERLGRRRAWAALWAFHPLVIVEFSGNGHLDSLMVAALVASLLMVEATAGQPATAGSKQAFVAVCVFSLSVLTKLVPILLAPFLLFALGTRRRWIALIPLLMALAYVPYAGAGLSAIFQSTETYLVHWSGNGPAFEAILYLCGGNGATARYWFWGGLGLLAAILWLMRWSPRRAALPLFGYYLVVGPMVHPWYLALVLPFVILDAGGERRGLPLALGAWLWLTLALPLDYLRYMLDPFPVWIPWTIWAPFWVGLVVAGLIRVLTCFQRSSRKAWYDRTQL